MGKGKDKTKTVSPSTPPSKFQLAVDKDLPGAYCSGLGAIKGSDRNKFDFLKDTRKINGSADIDTTVKKQFPTDNRWDYVVGYNEKAYFFEVHPMTEGEVATLIAKKDWLEGLLTSKVKNINKLKQTPFFWLPTDSGCAIPPRSRKTKMLELNKIEWRKILIVNHFASL